MDEYLIFSCLHLAFWAPGEQGFVSNPRRAARYHRDEAMRICSLPAQLGKGRRLAMVLELPVRADDLAEIQQSCPPALWPWAKPPG